MPAWIPGSYMIRDFARNLVSIGAFQGETAVAISKLDKQTWGCVPVSGRLRIEYEVYARELSVRAAYLDHRRGYFNGPSVFLEVEGRTNTPCRLELVPAQGEPYSEWEVATSLRPDGPQERGFGGYLAENYEDLIDHPVEMGRFDRFEFEVCGVPHEFVLSGSHRGDLERLRLDLVKVCEQQVGLFGELPCDRYLFLTLATGDGYGGLEHRYSTSLICGRNDLPAVGQKKINKEYRKFLGLCSHEYFHLWNVKRIRPRVFLEQGLGQEVHTRLLWVFEGFTSYYDDLALVRSGLIDRDAYLEELAFGLTRLLRGNGRTKQTLEASSFDAWTKFYKQDESAPNNIVSYYTKGALVAFALDLRIRLDSGGARSLDDVMRALWTRYGKPGRGLGEDEIEPLVEEVTGLDLGRFFDQALRGTDDLDWAPLLAEFGVEMRVRNARDRDDRGGLIGSNDSSNRPIPRVLGVNITQTSQEAVLGNVLDGGAAQRAGLAAGDSIVAVEGIRANAANLDSLVAAVPEGAPAKVHAFRGDELLEFVVNPQPAPADTCDLGLIANPESEVANRRDAWLSGIA